MLQTALLSAAAIFAAAAVPPRPSALPEVVVQAGRSSNWEANGAMAFTPDGALLVVGGKEVRLYEVATGLLVRSITLTRGPQQGEFDRYTGTILANLVAISADAKLIAAGVNNDTGGAKEVVVWEAATGRLLKRHPLDYDGLFFTRDGRLLVQDFRKQKDGRELPTPIAIDPLTGKEKGAAGPLFEEHAVAHDPEGRLWVRNETSAVRFDPRTKARGPALVLGRFDLLAFSADFTRAAIADSSGGKLRIVDVATGATLREVVSPPGEPRALSFAEGGARVVLHGDRPDEPAGHRGGLFSWSAATGEAAPPIELGRIGFAYHSRFAPGGRVLAVNHSEQLRFFDAITGRRIGAEVTSIEEPNQLTVSPDGNRILLASRGDRTPSSVKLWDLAAGKLQRRLPWGNASYSPDGDSALVLKYPVTVVDAKSFAVRRTFEAGKTDVAAVAWAPDGKRFALTVELTTEVYDAATNRLVGKVPGFRASYAAGGGKLATIDPNLNHALVFDAATLAKVAECEAPALQSSAAVALSPDGALLALAGAEKHIRTAPGVLRLFDAKTCAEKARLPVGVHQVSAVVFSDDGKRLASAGLDVQVWDAKTGRELVKLHARAPALFALFRPHHPDQLITAGEDGAVTIWDLAKKQRLAELYAFGESDYVALLADNRYSASRGALPKLAFRVGLRAFPFAQFDLRFNRPDAVLEALGAASPAQLAAARASVQKRLKRSGFTEAQLTGDLDLPEVFAEPPPPGTNERTLPMLVRAKDGNSDLDRLIVTVNDVPIGDGKGVPLRDRKARQVEEKVSIPLSRGLNRIQISALNARGAESLRRSFETTLEAPTAKPDLYLIAVGVSQYKDADKSLRYAAKDAADLAAFFETKRAAFGKVTVVRLLDGEATRDKIAAARAVLQQSTVDDEAVVFFAGHGLRDEKLDYYFATHDVDFASPSARGLPYEDLEALLDGIGARKKLLLIDTCNSGELDKDEATLVAASETKTSDGLVKSRGIKVVQAKTTALGLEGSTGALEDLFADLRRGSGVVAIASAGGAEFALESDAWHNGVFTYALLSTMAGGKARVSEVRDAVIEKVTALTAGKQRPTVRRENLSDDFSIY